MAAASAKYFGNNCAVFSWTLVQGDPTGDVLGKNFIDFVDRSVQFEGMFGPATLIIEGSNDGVNFELLTDAQGVTISRTAKGLEQIVEQCLQLRPRITGADGTTNIVVTLVSRKSK